MPEEMAVTQTTQVGVELLASPGTPPAGGSNIKLPTLKMQIDPDFASEEYAAMGERFDAISVPGKEKSKLTLSGPNSYAEMIYGFSALLGDATISTPAGGVNARKFLWAPLLTGIINGRTLQVQQGDAVRARQVNYGRITDLTLVADREKSTVDGSGYAQQMQDGITLTASPTSIPVVPVKPKHWKVYLDALAANVGTSKLTRCFSYSLGYTGAFGDIWPLDRDQASFASDVNLKPTLAMLLSMMADVNVANWWAQARAGRKYYIRFEAISDQLVDNYQTLSVTGTPTGGTFTLTYKGVTTSPITFNSTTHVPTAATIQTALAGLSTIGAGNVTCTGGPLDGTPVVVTFTGALADDTTLLTHADSFTGGSSPALSVVQTTIPYSQIIDVCATPNPGAFKDEAGAYTQEWPFKVLRDPLWTAGNASGTALMIAVVCGQTGL